MYESPKSTVLESSSGPGSAESSDTCSAVTSVGDPHARPRQSENPPAHHNRFGWVWTTLLTASLLGAGWWLLQSGHGGHTEEHATTEHKPVDPVVVTVARVTPRQVQRTVTVVGSLYGRDEITIRSKVSGRVTKIHHDVGDIVRSGDRLLEIDPTDYGLAVTEARRSLELELSKLGLAALPPEDFDIRKLPAVVRAQAEQENASSRFQRVSQLSRQGAIAAEEKDTANKDFAVAQAGFQQALLDAQTTLASVRHRQAALDTALQRLRDTRVVVPGEETPVAVEPGAPARLPTGSLEYAVSSREVSEGEMISATGADLPLFQLVIDRPLKLKATVPERHRSEIRVGQQVDVRVEYYPHETFQGEVSRVNPAVDRASRTFQVEILVANEDRRLSAGSFAQAAILTHVDPAAPTVPEEALVTFAGVTKVFVVNGNQVREVPVVTHGLVEPMEKDSSHAWMEIEGDLPAPAMVVTSGQSQLSNRTPVRLRGAEVANQAQESTR